MSRGRPSLDGWHRKFPHWLSFSRDVRFCTATIENRQTIEGGRNVQFDVLAFIEHFENFDWTTENNVQFRFVSVFGH